MTKRKPAKRKSATKTNDPFAEGADAFLAGEDETANPYPILDKNKNPNTDHLAWNDGWSEYQMERDQ